MSKHICILKKKAIKKTEFEVRWCKKREPKNVPSIFMEAPTLRLPEVVMDLEPSERRSLRLTERALAPESARMATAAEYFMVKECIIRESVNF